MDILITLIIRRLVLILNFWTMLAFDLDYVFLELDLNYIFLELHFELCVIST